MADHSRRATAAFALSLLDLTNLDDDCTVDDIAFLCSRAQTPFGTSAAICIWPRFVAEARSVLGVGHKIRIATVVNFPGGDMEIADVMAETREAIADGADEIDLVIPYRRLLEGDERSVTDMVSAVRGECEAPVLLKVILETGELKDASVIERAADLAIEAGADFIKTSTGKVSVNATLTAADIMLRVIRRSGRRIGFKPAGGISTVSEAALYLGLAETVMTPDWAMPSTFRFGASGLLDDILSVLNGTEPRAAASAGY